MFKGAREGNLIRYKKLSRKQRRSLKFRTDLYLHSIKCRGFWYVRSLTKKKNDQLWRRARQMAYQALTLPGKHNPLGLRVDISAPYKRCGVQVLKKDLTYFPAARRVKPDPKRPVVRGIHRAPAGSYRFGFDQYGNLCISTSNVLLYKQDFRKNLRFFGGNWKSSGCFKVIIHFITRFGCTSRLLKGIARIHSLHLDCKGREALKLSKSLSRSLVLLSFKLGQPVVKPTQ